MHLLINSQQTFANTLGIMKPERRSSARTHRQIAAKPGNSNMTPRIQGQNCKFFTTPLTRNSQGDLSTKKANQIQTNDQKASESCQNFNISNVGYQILVTCCMESRSRNSVLSSFHLILHPLSSKSALLNFLCPKENVLGRLLRSCDSSPEIMPVTNCVSILITTAPTLLAPK